MDASPTPDSAPVRSGWAGVSAWRWVLILLTTLAVGFSLLIRLTAGGRQPLWLDEAWTLAVASLPSWGEVVRHTWLDANAPLYYAFMHVWGGLFGFSDALSLRLQTLGISSYLVLSVPYLVALAALFALAYRARPKIIRETLETMSRVMRPKPASGKTS